MISVMFKVTCQFNIFFFPYLLFLEVANADLKDNF